MSDRLKLISHPLCPYVQRAVIVLTEKQVEFERVDIDLADKPAWFLSLSPTGKTPLLIVGETHALFESAAIVEYLDESTKPALMPSDPIKRARSRAWIEFASGTLADIAVLYSAPDEWAFADKCSALKRRFVQIDAVLVGPWFAGEQLGLVDAAFAPVVRYLDTFERLADLKLADGLVHIAKWRGALAKRPSVASAVAPDYPARLEKFLLAWDAHLTRVIIEHSLVAAS